MASIHISSSNVGPSNVVFNMTFNVACPNAVSSFSVVPNMTSSNVATSNANSSYKGVGSSNVSKYFNSQEFETIDLTEDGKLSKKRSRLTKSSETTVDTQKRSVRNSFSLFRNLKKLNEANNKNELNKPMSESKRLRLSAIFFFTAKLPLKSIFLLRKKMT